jgi:hypothetical protein
MTNDTESIKAIIDRISNTLIGKGGEYKESVISVLPRGDWLSQIVIKANRAQRAVSDEKLKDELLDTACYCILLLDKIERETSKPGGQAMIDMITSKTMRAP